MFQRFVEAGVAVAGIDVGESYGSPDGRKLFSSLYRELTGKRGFASKPVLLGRSRGGPMQLIVPSGQGHNMWPGFFQCQELVDFVLEHALGEVSESLASRTAIPSHLEYGTDSIRASYPKIIRRESPTIVAVLHSQLSEASSICR